MLAVVDVCATNATWFEIGSQEIFGRPITSMAELRSSLPKNNTEDQAVNAIRKHDYVAAEIILAAMTSHCEDLPLEFKNKLLAHIAAYGEALDNVIR